MNKKDELKERVLLVLQSLRQGERIKGAALVRRTGVPAARSLRQIIRAMRNEGYLIGSAREGKRGYFLIRSEDELEETVRTMEAAARDQLRTAKNLRKAFQQKRLIVQPSERSIQKGER